MDDSPKKKTKWVWPVVVFVGVAVVAFLIYAWLNPNTTYNTNDNTEYSNYLSCSAKTVRESFFDPSGATAVEHQIKVTFSNAKPNKVNYVFKATYETEAMAEQKSSSMHADYNIYMGGHDARAESLTPTFSSIGKELTVNLFGEKSTINTVTAPMFLLTSDEAMKFFTLSSSDVSKFYNAQGLSCVLYE